LQTASTGRGRALLTALLAIIFAFGVAACGGGDDDTGGTTAAAGGGGGTTAGGGEKKMYKVGVSNTLQGNGWREEMICSIKAQAKVSGQVSEMIIANKTQGTPQQIADIRNLISAGVDIIVLNPSNPEALGPVVKQATDKGITVVSVDQGVNEESAYSFQNDQVKYGELGAEWLFKKLGGKGDVVEMRGIEGAQADTDRHEGFMRALERYPDIKVVKSVFTNWALAPAAKATQDILNSGQNVDGIWTSGLDIPVVEAYKTAGKPFVPIVGADNNGFIGKLLNEKGLEGAAVTNPPPVGGAGLALALKVKNGEDAPKEVKLTPEVWDQTDMNRLKEAYDPELDPFYAVATSIPDWTTYSKQDLIGCQGP
jgi:ribose transport system substrate-binding protein